MHCKKNNCAITTISLLVDLLWLSPTFGWQQDPRYAQNILSWESISLSRLQHDELKFCCHDKIPLNMSCNASCSYFDSICSLLLRKIQMWWCQVVFFFLFSSWMSQQLHVCVVMQSFRTTQTGLCMNCSAAVIALKSICASNVAKCSDIAETWKCTKR